MPILSQDSYEFLLDSLEKFTGNYLEIGVYDGDGLRSFALKWPERTFYGIDPFISDKDTTGHTGVPIGGYMQSQKDSSIRNFQGVKNIIFYEQTSKCFMDLMSDERLSLMNVEVVYVDGNHSYDDTLNDLNLSQRLIKGDGMIYIDDFNLPEVLRATGVFVFANPRVFAHNERIILLKP